VYRALGCHARVAWRAAAQVIVDGTSIGVGELAVDVGRDQRVERSAVKH
jgi:hypothetical protein